MKKHLRTYILAGVLAVMGVTYLIFFTGGGDPAEMMILTRLDRPRRFNPEYPIYAVRFGLNAPYKLSEVKVERIGEPEPEPEQPTGERIFTLESARRETAATGPLWHLVAEDGRSEPTQAFSYGGRIRGMQRADSSQRSRPLEPGVKYRLTVRAGRVSNTTEFETSFFQEPQAAQAPGGPGPWPFFRGDAQGGLDTDNARMRQMLERMQQERLRQIEQEQQRQNAQPAEPTQPAPAETEPQPEADAPPPPPQPSAQSDVGDDAAIAN